jgi:hypothetical protein
VTVDSSACDEWFLEVQKHMTLNQPASASAFTPSGKVTGLPPRMEAGSRSATPNITGGMAGRPARMADRRPRPHPSGKGYLLLGGDGGVFAFGDATYMGRAGAASAASDSSTEPSADSPAVPLDESRAEPSDESRAKSVSAQD